MTTYYENTKNIIQELSDLLLKVDQKDVENYMNEVTKAKKIFFVGVGRVELALEATVKRFSHLGLNCYMVGALDEPPIGDKDLLIVGSGSGESLFPLGITNKAQKYGAKIVHLTSNPNSSIAQKADIIVRFESPSKTHSNIKSIQPITTVFEQGLLVFHDILTLEFMQEMGLSFEDLKTRHANLE
ncbi:SIS domain-containing protein [Tetragenococcus koreensis]|uniref:SIS domain-containing protein n=1 Tax=Tetragenococcus koreensis TaxID=290335 RepID=UPI001F47260B|nr:SIS domain-containing protein [Tetragenococcus koreensis]MCF1618858.1 SIS domain-containing protein [Tetragenococcus koreensis]MCF1656339.1 SIS domain-containing protein [Tetragenococcus koreensis]